MFTEDEARQRGFSSNVHNYVLVIVLEDDRSILKTPTNPGDKHFKKVLWSTVGPKLSMLKYEGSVNDALSLCKDCMVPVISCIEYKGKLIRTEHVKMVYEAEPILGSKLIEKMLDI